MNDQVTYPPPEPVTYKDSDPHEQGARRYLRDSNLNKYRSLKKSKTTRINTEISQ